MLERKNDHFDTAGSFDSPLFLVKISHWATKLRSVPEGLTWAKTGVNYGARFGMFEFIFLNKYFGGHNVYNNLIISGIIFSVFFNNNTILPSILLDITQ